MSEHIADLFANKQQYWTPLYQRRYVWDTPNWEAFWRDLLKIQHQIDAGEDNQHFTGTIVTQPYENSQEKYEIIDGQQRLTTFQIIFCVIRDLCASGVYPSTITSEIESDVVGFAKLSALQMGGESSPYRLLITKERDKDAFQSVVSRELGERIKEVVLKALKTPQSSDVDELSDPDRMIVSALKEFRSLADGEQLGQNRIITAYGYFGTKIMNYLAEEGTAKLLSLTQTLSYRFHVNHAHLGSNDGPQQVFESINDTGKALDEFDLLRNDLFLRVGDRTKQEEWYEEFWRDFDEEPFWEETGRVDEFLRYFLTAKLGPMVFGGKRLFHDIYKGKYHEKLRDELDRAENNLEFIKREFQELVKYAATYQEMETDPTKDIGRRRLFYKDLNLIFEDLDLTSLPPFLLHIKNELALDKNKRDQVYKILESYVLRCQLRHGVSEDKTTRERINGLFAKLIDGDINKSEIVKEFVDHLSRRRHGRRWLGNQGISDGFRKVSEQMDKLPSSLRRPIWNMLGYILYRIECSKQKTMPIAFKEFSSSFLCTPIIFPSKSEKAFSHKHSIGNLTFCDEYPLPSRFPDRQKFLLKEPNANLILNSEMDGYSTWGVPQIEARTESLLTYFYNIWPPAEHFLGDAAESKVKFSISQTSKPTVEPRWISLIQSDNSESITFVTYSGVAELSEIKILGDKVIGINHASYEQTLEKQNILFTSSTTVWPEVSPYIETLSYVRSERLQPPRHQGEQLNIVNKIFTSAQQKQAMVSLVTRCGHLLEGTIEDFDKDAIYMQIRECLIVIYRHSIYELATGEWAQGVVTEFDEVQSFGYIKSSDHPRIFVHRNEVRGRNSRVLQPGQKVEFDLNRTTKGLSAIDVVLIEE